MASSRGAYALRTTPNSSSEMLHNYPARAAPRYPPSNKALSAPPPPPEMGNETPPPPTSTSTSTETVRCQSYFENVQHQEAPTFIERDPTIALKTTFAELETTLRQHGSDLHKLEILASTPGRAGQLQRGLPTPPALDGYMTPEASETRGFPRARNSLGLGIPHGHGAIEALQQALPNEFSEESEGSDEDDGDAESFTEKSSMELKHFSILQSVHPLLYDVGDLKALTAGVTRLLRTLHEKVNQVETEARLLRAERQELVKQKKATRELQQELEKEKESIQAMKEKTRREAWKARELKMEAQRLEKEIREQSEKDTIKAIVPEKLTRTMGTQTKIRTPIGLPERAVTSPSTKPLGEPLQLKRSVSFGVPDSPRVSISEPPPLPESTWSPEKEELLRSLETRLRQANMKWSDEQEDVLAEIEPLKEERRRAKKMARRATEPSNRDAVYDLPPLEKKSSKVSLKLRRGSDGDEPPQKPAGGIMKLFGGGKKGRRRSVSD